MKVVKIIIFLILGISSSIPVIAENAIDDISQLQWLKNADPIADANKAIIAKKYTLFAVEGYTWEIPGVSEDNKFDYRKKYGITIIKGTSDVVLNKEHARLIELAEEYARRYNLQILKHLKK